MELSKSLFCLKRPTCLVQVWCSSLLPHPLLLLYDLAAVALCSPQSKFSQKKMSLVFVLYFDSW